MRWQSGTLFGLLAAVGVWWLAPPRAAADEKLEFFERRIRPVLVEHCYECHSARVESVKGGLRVDHRRGLLVGGDSGPALLPGEPGESLLLEALRYESYQMPPDGKLPARVIDDFAKWIEMGASDPREDVADGAEQEAVAKAGDLWSIAPIMDFDFPDPGMVAGCRETTNVPSQSLLLMNSPLVLDCAEGLAVRVLDASIDPHLRIGRLFQWSFSRSPTPREMAQVREMVAVRFVEVNDQWWDSHNHHRECLEGRAWCTDQPVAALLTDLKQRGLLEDTLVLWGGEFGRTIGDMTKDGSDHNPHGFTMWMAGGGVQGGFSHGGTDETGQNAVEGRMHIHDLHATILHLLGLDHTRLTYRYAGRDFRLTDVHGQVVREILS